MDDDLSNVDPGAIAGEIGAELGFSKESPEAGDNGETAPPAGEAAPGLTAAQARALPKAWKKEMESYWSQLPPQVHDYVYEREANVMRGIQQYQQGHSSWSKLLEPYQEIFSANPNIDPVSVLQTVMNQHLQLARGTPEQKKELASQMLKAYGLELESLNAQAPGEDPRIATLEQRLKQVESLWQNAQEALKRDVYQKNLTTVEAFSTDPKNLYWGEVVEDVHSLLKKGAASTLEEAYELACLKNPAVRAKIVATSGNSSPSPSSSSERFPNLNGAEPRGKPRPKSIDATIDAVVAKHYSTH